MQDLALELPAAARGILIAVAGLAAFVLWRWHGRAFAPAKRRSSRGIVAFELARTRKRSAEILSAWGSEGRTAARKAVRIDFAFAVAYAVLLWLACASLAGVVGERTWGWMEEAGWWLSTLVLVAGLLDWIENWALLRMLATFEPGEEDGGIGKLHPPVAAVAAIVKFAFVIPALLYVVFGLAVLWAGTP